MPFYINVGYRFPIPEGVEPDGSILFAATMPSFQLSARLSSNTPRHLRNRLFDPQVYMAGLDTNTDIKHCINLSSYPWFRVSGLNQFSSNQNSVNDWKKRVETTVRRNWRNSLPNEPRIIEDSVRDCIDFQIQIGVSAIVLPSPLSTDPSSDYSSELQWIDSGIRYSREHYPAYNIIATIALSDACMRYSPINNPFVEQILDSISSRNIDGVYIVIEQLQELPSVRNCATANTILTLFHMVHVFSSLRFQVAVNFVGVLGLLCRAIGANIWAAGWYKSLYRFKIGDGAAEGRAYPLYWSRQCALDVNMHRDIEKIPIELLNDIEDNTFVSRGLFQALRSGVKLKDVPAWNWKASNVSAATQHFYLSVIEMENQLNGLSSEEKLNFISDWLNQANITTQNLATVLGREMETKIAHVLAWNNAFQEFRQSHLV